MSAPNSDALLTLSQLRGLASPDEQPREAARERALERLGRIPHYAQLTRLDLARPTINFHPDRPGPGGRSVIEGLWADGVYRNQFEVRITNGDPTAFPGGKRHRRESEMFGGWYDDTPASDRPKYGSLDLFHGPLGGWPRFGSSYLVLVPAVLDRSTFLVGGGLSRRSWVGTRSALEELLADARPSVCAEPRRSWRSDGWVEMHVHGPVRLAHDVLMLVMDDSFQDTPAGDIAIRVAERYGVEFEWAPGLRSDTRTWRVPADRCAPRALVAAAVFRDRICSAYEIGRVLYTCFERTREIVPMDAATRDGVAKYFWNRMLLSDDVSARWVGPLAGREAGPAGRTTG
jgi:hypothetical protein